MSEVMTRRALAGSFGEVKAGNIVEVKARNIVEANSATSACIAMSAAATRSIASSARAFFSRKIYPLFGFYPWRCKKCGLRLMLRKRESGGQAGRR